MKHIPLRKARKKARLTQERLAALIGVKQSTVSKWEREPSTKLDYDTHTALARYLGVNPQMLTFGVQDSTEITR